ncbi:hypothetical protein QKD39_gp30 [Psittacine adenovirus 1]|uniref:Uncharacterized protein n=1 Tax=Psittacine adenovirus 1 TaxID=318592 RepID=A0A2Z5E1D3_9ADEN|nr:hypothetical protein QKD39_gp30 [Psittacine adenovirus 1]AXB73042.1 hypothetical protein [Psittacine adenovirus 1]
MPRLSSSVENQLRLRRELRRLVVRTATILVVVLLLARRDAPPRTLRLLTRRLRRDLAVVPRPKRVRRVSAPRRRPTPRIPCRGMRRGLMAPQPRLSLGEIKMDITEVWHCSVPAAAQWRSLFADTG